MHAPAARSSDEWLETVATVTGCRRTVETALRDAFSSSESDEIPTAYVVRFEYDAMGMTRSGYYESTVPRECGYTFEILYDPSHPERNTGFDLSPRRSIRIALRVGGVILGLIIAWLCIKLGIRENFP
jgi:hypothetical protein